MTPRVTVLIPTHDHARLLPYALRSAMRQNLRDIEIFVVGDGAGEATRDAVASLADGDSRIRYFDLPKGERHGEANRHIALQEAQGQVVAYLCDDDLWRSDHLDNVVAGLAQADFVHTLHTGVLPNGEMHVFAADLALSHVPLAMLTQKKNFFGPTVVAHTMASYRALPFGWRPAPADVWTDLHMWRQFLAQPNIRLRTLPVCDTLHFASPLRSDMTQSEREAEIASAFARLIDGDGCGDPQWQERARASLLAERDVLFPERLQLAATLDDMVKQAQALTQAYAQIEDELSALEDDMTRAHELAAALVALPPSGLAGQPAYVRRAHEKALVAALDHAGFDRAFYLEAHPDVARSGYDATMHYVRHGCREQRRFRLTP